MKKWHVGWSFIGTWADGCRISARAMATLEMALDVT